MEIERRVGAAGRIELWGYEWDLTQKPAKKTAHKFLGYETPIRDPAAVTREAICWSYGRTLGNITVSSEDLLGLFPGQEGDDAKLDCDIVDAGKMRNGAARWWCRTHQRHWGTKGDIAGAKASGKVQCANHDQPMSYVVDPTCIDIQRFAEVGIWCSMPPALSHNGPSKPRRPKIHVHIREKPGEAKVVDGDFKALSLRYNSNNNLFGSHEITRVHLTPPSALEFVLALESGKAMDCINCYNCGYPHLDLGDFAREPHTKHLCGNCGRDNTRSKAPISSTPLKPLHDQFSKANNYVDVITEIDLDDYPGRPYQIWASTPAVLWTADRPQERGIHVHIYGDGKYLVDDTFGTVRLKGKVLERDQLLQAMVESTFN